MGRGGRVGAAAIVVAVALIAGCGGSSKPSYCSSVASLKSSVKALPQTDVIKNGTSALTSAVTKIQTDAQSAVSDAKSDFPDETSTVTSSVNALATTAKQLTSSPSAATIAQVPGQVKAVVTAVDGFASATSSKCD
jgi:hypothetical protein